MLLIKGQKNVGVCALQSSQVPSSVYCQHIFNPSPKGEQALGLQIRQRIGFHEFPRNGVRRWVMRARCTVRTVRTKCARVCVCVGTGSTIRCT